MNQVTPMAKICDQSSGRPVATGVREPVKGREDAERAGKAAGDRGDRGRLGDRKPRPHVEEGGGVAVGAAQVDVLAAGIGQHRAEFRIGHGAEEREQAADNPREIDERGRAGVFHHFAGHEEDAAADDGPHHDGRGLAGAEHAGQIGRDRLRRRGIGLTHAGDVRVA